MRSRHAALALALLPACTPKERAGESAQSGQTPATTRGAPPPTSPPGAGEAPAAPEASPPDGGAADAAGEPRPAPAPPSFPPAPVPPPHERSRQPGDGTWELLGSAEAGDRAAEPPRVLARTRVHPHPTSRFITTHVVAIDLSRTSIHYVPGTEDPAPQPEPARPVGKVAPRHLDDVLGVFNGGFQPRHGWWGMMVGGAVLVKPRPDGCTIALTKGGSVRMGSVDEVTAGDDTAAYRQTPPCLVRDGEISRLAEKNHRIYGGNNADRPTRRRSALGIDEAGAVLFFAVAEEGGPRHLAQGLKAVGAHVAAQLDINWNWTRFLLVGDTPDGPRITSTFLPNMNHGKRQYVERPSQRDFFYIVRGARTEASP